MCIMAKHRSPCKIRYDQQNPPLTIRFTRDLRDVLSAVQGSRKPGPAIKDIVKGKLEPVLVLKQQMDRMQAERKEECRKCREELRQYCLNELKKRMRIQVPCSCCGEKIDLTNYSRNWDAEIYPAILAAFEDWQCSKCSNKE